MPTLPKFDVYWLCLEFSLEFHWLDKLRTNTGTGLKQNVNNKKGTHLLSVSILTGAILDSSISAGCRRSVGAHAFARALSGTLLSSAWNREKHAWGRPAGSVSVTRRVHQPFHRNLSHTWWRSYTFLRRGVPPPNRDLRRKEFKWTNQKLLFCGPHMKM